MGPSPRTSAEILREISPAFPSLSVVGTAPDMSVLWNAFAVLSFSLTRILSSDLMRMRVVVASLLGPWAILLSLLGLFDQWFDFRGRFTSRETKADPSDQNLQ